MSKGNINDKVPPENKWVQAYARATVAGRVLHSDVFPNVMAALDLEAENPTKAKKLFFAACRKVIEDEALINDMWKATTGARKAQSAQPCW